MTIDFEDDDYSNDDGHVYAGLSRFDSFKSQLAGAGLDDDSADIMAGILVDDEEFGIEHRSESDELHAAGCADLINLGDDDWEDMGELRTISPKWTDDMDGIDFGNAAVDEWIQLGEIDPNDEFEVEFELYPPAVHYDESLIDGAIDEWIAQLGGNPDDGADDDDNSPFDGIDAANKQVQRWHESGEVDARQEFSFDFEGGESWWHDQDGIVQSAWHEAPDGTDDDGMRSTVGTDRLDLLQEDDFSLDALLSDDN